MESEFENKDALAAIDAGRAAAADRLVTPWWYHPILGLLVAGLLVTNTLGNLAVRLIGLVVYGILLALLVTAYRRITSVWISGFSARRASVWTYALVATLIIAIIGGLVLYNVLDTAWPVWVGAALAFAAVNVFGRLFDRSLRANLRAGTIPAAS